MYKVLIAGVLAASLWACGSSREVPEDLAGRWDVQEIAGAPLGEGVDIWFEIDASTGAMTGSTGCNEFTATMTSFAESLAIGAVTMTERACLDQAAATDEARFIRVLPAVQRRIRRGRSLELLPMASGSETLIRARLAD